MTKILVKFMIIIFSYKSFGQSLTERKIYEILLSQQNSFIDYDLIQMGFDYYKEKSTDNTNIFVKYRDKNNVEVVNYTTNDEMFCIQYKPLKSYYSTYKEILLTSKYKYSHTLEDNKYYDWQGLRIGINDKLKLISVFIALKKFLPNNLSVDQIIINK